MSVTANNFILVLYQVFVFLVLVQNQSYGTKSSSICIDNINSTCYNVGTTKWNKHNVGENLKLWIQSVDQVPVKRNGLKTQSNYKKRIKRHPRSNILTFIGNMECSSEKIIGPIWKIGGLASRRQFHNGFLYGTLNEEEALTGNEISYLYPDMKTVLFGHFENGTMIAAKESRVIAERCHQGMKEIKVAKPKTDDPIYKYNIPTRIKIADQPTLMDPYTRKNIYISEGKEGDGVFARRNISQGEVIMYYSGIRWNKTEMPLWSKNQTKDERLDIGKNLMASGEKGITFNVPKEYWKVEKYRATLGHKMNHSFRFNKAQMMYASHPRFGDVKAYYAKENITKGEEIFVNYGYKKGQWVPKWYSMLYKKETGENWYSK